MNNLEVGKDIVSLRLSWIPRGGGQTSPFLIMWRVSRVGFPVKTFANLRDTIRLLKTYRQIAPGRGWSLWPITGYWVCVAGMFAAVFIFVFTGGLRIPAVISIRIGPALILTWVSVTLFLALWFTYRLIRKIPRLETGRRNWGHLLQDKYSRSDLYLAILGWVALLGAPLAMLIR